MERLVSEYRGVRTSAAYVVPDPAVGDRVMVAVELNTGFDFDPAEFDQFLADHPDMGPKWQPSFVRVMEALPVLASLKIDKRTLRREAWECDDPVWWRRGRAEPLTMLGPEDVADMSALLHRPEPSAPLPEP